MEISINGRKKENKSSKQIKNKQQTTYITVWSTIIISKMFMRYQAYIKILLLLRSK